MSNYFKTVDISNLCISNGHINQNRNTLAISVSNNRILKITNDTVTVNNYRVLTTLDKFNSTEKITFASGIFLGSGINYLRYCGNSDSGYDKDLRVSNIYRNPYAIKIKKISIQKGYAGSNTITIPTLNYTKVMTGNFYSEDTDINIGINSHIYVSTTGTPMEVFIDIYFEFVENQLPPVVATISSIFEPTHYELFGYSDGVVLAKYPIQV